MISTAKSGSQNASLLEPIIAANYEEYRKQREHLRDLFENDPRFARYRQSSPPPPPAGPPPADPVPPPPPPPPPSEPKQQPESKQGLTKVQRKMQASRDRAARLKLLRPDIPSVPDSISNEQALALGGYRSQSEMDRDLAAREKELAASKKRD